MSWRTVIISSRSKLDYRAGYLVVRGNDIQKVFLDEVAVIVIENPAVSLTGCLIQAVTEKKIKMIFCDQKHNPCAELIPHHGSHDSSMKIRTQIAWNDAIKAAVWREIITEKIRKQAAFLKSLEKQREYDLLTSYIGQVDLMDASNREGHAAKVYFNALFGMEFTRTAENPINAALNYGYSILLSVVNREISANGYISQLGIFHSNMYNHFNLESDLMEPFRVLIDREVYYLEPTKFEKEEKHNLWEIMNQMVRINGSSQTVLNAVRIYTRSVFEAMNDEDPAEILFYQAHEL